MLASPSLDIRSMKSLVTSYIHHHDIFNRIENSFVLPNTTKSNAKPVIKGAIEDANIGAVGFESDAVISICDIPTFKCDVIREYSISTICVTACRAVIASVVDVGVLEEDILAVDYGHRPASC